MSATAGRVALGTVASLGRIGVTFAVWFFLTPYMVRMLGQEGYGLWSLVFSLVGFLSLLDLGTGAGVVRAVAEARGHGRNELRDETLSTYLASSLVLASAGVLVVAVIDHFALSALGVPASVRSTARTVLWLVALRSFVLALPLGFFRGILFGENRQLALNLAQAGAALGGGLLTAAALFLGLGLTGAAAAGLAAMLLEHFAYYLLARRHLRGMRLSPGRITLASLRRASSLGMAQMLIAASGLVLLRTDPIVVQAFVGMAAVSVYAVAMKVAENTFLIIKQFVNALSPVIAEWHAAGRLEALRDLLLRATRLALIPASLIGGAALGGGGTLLRLWLGPEFEAAALPMRLLVLSMILTVPQMVVFGLLTYSDRHQLPARASVVAAICNVLFSLLLVRPLGLAGVALGTLLATLLVDVLYVLREGTAAFDVAFGELLSKALAPTLLPLAGQAALLHVWLTLVPATGFIDLAARLGVASLLAAFALARLALLPAERHLLMVRFETLGARLRPAIFKAA